MTGQRTYKVFGERVGYSVESFSFSFSQRMNYNTNFDVTIFKLIISYFCCSRVNVLGIGWVIVVINYTVVTTTIVPSTSIWVHTTVWFANSEFILCINNIIKTNLIVIVIHNFKLDFNDWIIDYAIRNRLIESMNVNLPKKKNKEKKVTQ